MRGKRSQFLEEKIVLVYAQSGPFNKYKGLSGQVGFCLFHRLNFQPYFQPLDLFLVFRASLLGGYPEAKLTYPKPTTKEHLRISEGLDILKEKERSMVRV